MSTLAEIQAEADKANDEYFARIIAVKKLREQGYSFRDIGKGLGISHEYARKLLSITLDR